MNLFNEAELESDQEQEAATVQTETMVSSHTSRPKRTSREIFRGIPVVEEIMELLF